MNMDYNNLNDVNLLNMGENPNQFVPITQFNLGEVFQGDLLNRILGER